MMEKHPYRALAIEGGGMRGYYAATLLDNLCRRFNNSSSVDFGERLDLICGTSTGAILACAIAKGISMQKIMEMYKTEGKKIFPRPVPKNILKLVDWGIRHCLSHSANEKHLLRTLERNFKKQTLGELYDKRQIALCIPAVDASNYCGWVFKTPHNPGKIRDNDYQIVDVCMASAAAPILFPPHEIQSPDNSHNIKRFIDGGLWANNPTLMALIEAVQVAKPNQDIHILSVGLTTTPNSNSTEFEKNKWGLFRWKFGLKITEISIHAHSNGYDDMANFLVNIFSKNGRIVKILQLKETQKSSDKYGCVGFDRADEHAIQIMAQMAESDALENHSMITTRNENTEIKDFFTPAFKQGETQ